MAVSSLRGPRLQRPQASSSPRHQRSRGQRSRRLQPLDVSSPAVSGPDACSPWTPAVPRGQRSQDTSGQRSRCPQPLDTSGPKTSADLRCQRPLATNSLAAKCLITPSHEWPCSQRWPPLGGSLVGVASWGAESVSSGLSSLSSSLSSLPLHRWERPCLVQNGLFLGAALSGEQPHQAAASSWEWPCSEWPLLGSGSDHGVASSAEQPRPEQPSWE